MFSARRPRLRRAAHVTAKDVTRDASPGPFTGLAYAPWRASNPPLSLQQGVIRERRHLIPR